MPKRDKSEKKILYVDDEPINLEIFKLNFVDQYTIHTATSGCKALEIYKAHPDIGIILTDQKMPGMSGVELLANIFQLNPDTIRIIVTAYTEFRNILEAINRGHIYHYVIKPWDRTQLGIILEQGFKTWRLISENKRLLAEQERSNERLREANQRLQLLSQKLIHAQEDERRRISMDLHDDIGQNLIALKLQFSNFCSQVDANKSVEAAETMTIFRSAMQKTIDNTRNLCQNLSPAIIEEFGFDLALKDFLDSFSRNYGIEVVAGEIEIGAFLQAPDQHQLYRIMQEVFNNIGKHAKTERVRVESITTPEFLTLQVTDFGCGFDPHQSRPDHAEGRSLGLTTISERTTVLGGTFHIRSSHNEGTTFTITIPCSRELG
jgi:signal transduction histidine kinase